MKAPRVYGLNNFGLTLSGLMRSRSRKVRFSVQLAGRKLSRLLHLRPRQRDAQLRSALAQQLSRLQHRFPDAHFTSRGKRKASWTVDGILPAGCIHEVAKSPDVQYVMIESVDGLRRRHAPPGLGWYCVWGLVAVQVEGQVKGNVTVEDRLVLVRATDRHDAEQRLRSDWAAYGKPYLNPDGYLVRWQLIGVRDVHELYANTIDPSGTEVYSRLRTVRMMAQYRWRPSRRGV